MDGKTSFERCSGSPAQGPPTPHLSGEPAELCSMLLQIRRKKATSVGGWLSIGEAGTMFQSPCEIITVYPISPKKIKQSGVTLHYANLLYSMQNCSAPSSAVSIIITYTWFSYRPSTSIRWGGIRNQIKSPTGHNDDPIWRFVLLGRGEEKLLCHIFHLMREKASRFKLYYISRHKSSFFSFKGKWVGNWAENDDLKCLEC